MIHLSSVQSLSAGSGLHPDTQDYLTRLGGTLSSGQTAAVDTFVKLCYQKGWRNASNPSASILQDVCLFVGGTKDKALVKLWYPAGKPSTLIDVGGGIQPGDYSDAQGINPTTTNGQVGQPAREASLGVTAGDLGASNTSGHLCVANTANDQAHSRPDFGFVTNTGYGTGWNIYARSSGDNKAYYLQDSITDLVASPVMATSLGFYVGSTFSTGRYLDRNGVEIAAGVVDPNPLNLTTPLQCLRMPNYGPNSGYGRIAIGYYSVGSTAIPRADAADYYNAVKTCLAAWGRSI